jgi:hypothetical protein
MPSRTLALSILEPIKQRWPLNDNFQVKGEEMGRKRNERGRRIICLFSFLNVAFYVILKCFLLHLVSFQDVCTRGVRSVKEILFYSNNG